MVGTPIAFAYEKSLRAGGARARVLTGSPGGPWGPGKPGSEIPSVPLRPGNPGE